MASHLASSAGSGTSRTFCGLIVTPYTELAREGDPTCRECAAIDEADGASLLGLQQAEYTPVPPTKPFSSIDGYKPKAERR